MDSALARRRLMALLEELDSSSGTLTHENADGTGELSHLDQHPAEAASELSEQQRDNALVEVLTQQREQVLQALARLDSGTYGRCVDCGQELPEERLEARPEAARCVDCQHTMELAR